MTVCSTAHQATSKTGCTLSGNSLLRFRVDAFFFFFFEREREEQNQFWQSYISPWKCTYFRLSVPNTSVLNAMVTLSGEATLSKLVTSLLRWSPLLKQKNLLPRCLNSTYTVCYFLCYRTLCINGDISSYHYTYIYIERLSARQESHRPTAAQYSFQ